MASSIMFWSVIGGGGAALTASKFETKTIQIEASLMVNGMRVE
jgi:hypothetical protein